VARTAPPDTGSRSRTPLRPPVPPSWTAPPGGSTTLPCVLIATSPVAVMTTLRGVVMGNR
jgi:hypothetical protein